MAICTNLFGTWQAKFKGKIFQTLKLEIKQGKLTGTVSHANVGVDQSGELTDVEVLDGSDAITEAKLTSGLLRITEQDAIQFEMKITGANQAQIQIIYRRRRPARFQQRLSHGSWSGRSLADKNLDQLPLLCCCCVRIVDVHSQ